MNLLVGSELPLMEVAAAAGFDSISVFHEHFHALNGMTPKNYRALRSAGGFTQDQPPGYPRAHLRRSHARDPVSGTARLVAGTYEAAVDLPRIPLGDPPSRARRRSPSMPRPAGGRISGLPPTAAPRACSGSTRTPRPSPGSPAAWAWPG